jgi:hypothetical protein
MRDVIKRFAGQPWFSFALVFFWKLALLLVAGLPVPSNDSFFYDGPVVNLLLQGDYANPSLALALPISGNEVFSAYPPFYQLVLAGWMFVFGTSALSSMWFHLVLFGGYMWVLYQTLRRLGAGQVGIGVAALFLLAITFHDRPDSLAHLLGLSSIYCWIRSRTSLGPSPEAHPAKWAWYAAGLVVLTISTGLQLGAFYAAILGAGMFTTACLGKDRFPWLPMLSVVLVPAGLVSLVIFGLPYLWAGFLEHAEQTPALTGWRVPAVYDLLKLLRTVPGTLAALVLVPWIWLTWKREASSIQGPGGSPPVQGVPPAVVVAGVCTAVSGALLAAAMVFVTPNAVSFALYVQPLIAGCCLGLIQGTPPVPRQMRFARSVFVGLALLASIRAFGLSTWGLACAADVSRSAALAKAEAELKQCPAQSSVVLSSAYLYNAASRTNLHWIHSDWVSRADPQRKDGDVKGLLHVRPAKLILTQFDYYRRYEPAVRQLQGTPGACEVTVENLARFRVPDSDSRLQRVVQHLSWAPVVVSFRWK